MNASGGDSNGFLLLMLLYVLAVLIVVALPRAQMLVAHASSGD